MEKSTVKEKVRQFMREQFLVEFGGDITDDTDLFKSGAIDSYGYIKLLKFFEEDFKIKFSEEEILANIFVTFSSIVENICKKTESNL